MTWDHTPYFTQFPGAAHSPEVFRAALYASTGGHEGIVGPTDCKVVAQNVPGTSVVVSAGNVLVLCRAAGHSQETYAARNPGPDTVAVTATGSTARSDLVVVRIEDPGLDGEPWDDPANPAEGPYVFTRIIPNVPAGTTRLQDVPGHANDTGYALARIDIPANTGTIIPAHITDLRAIANPRTERAVVKGTRSSGVLTLTNAYQNFPPNGVPGVPIPAWATHMTGVLKTNYGAVENSPYFSAQAYLSDTSMVADTMFASEVIDGTAVPVAGRYRAPFELETNGWFPVPARLRGTTQRFMSRVQGVISGVGAKIQPFETDPFYVDVTFTERAS